MDEYDDAVGGIEERLFDLPGAINGNNRDPGPV
jgi:hypothetical protein